MSESGKHSRRDTRDLQNQTPDDFNDTPLPKMYRPSGIIYCAKGDVFVIASSETTTPIQLERMEGLRLFRALGTWIEANDKEIPE